MTSDKELKLAYRLAVVLFVIGVLSFAAFPAKPPETPVRVMYKTNAGKVFFDHKTHASVTGYGAACTDCHHPHPADAEEAPYNDCAGCHPGSKSSPEQLATIQQRCNESHEDYSPEDIMPRADAFHSQCITCHKDFEAGPVACASCHVI